jgi:hypothetical protein
MRNVRRTLRSCVIMLVLCTPGAAGPATPHPAAAPENLQEPPLRRALAEKTVSWLQTRSADTGRQCDKLAESLLALDKASALSYFAAAQSARLRGQPQVALARLTKVVEEQGDLRAPCGIVTPVKAVAPLWIATIIRYSGSMAPARDEYKKLLARWSENVKENGADMLFIYLHLAEIEADQFKNPKEAVVHLQAADDLVASNRGEKPPGLGSKWIQYERTKLTHGTAQANHELAGDRDMLSIAFLVSIHNNVMGLTDHPLADCCLPGVKDEPIGEAIMKLVLESEVAKIDKMFMQFSVACYYEKKNPSEAVKRHLELLESDSFIAPVAGLYAARIERNEGRAAEARDIVDRLCARFPQFRSLAKDLERSER